MENILNGKTNKDLQNKIRFSELILPIVLYKLPFLSNILKNVQISANSFLKTAATDGHSIQFSPMFFNDLNYSEQAFVIAHEAMHIALNHIRRQCGKDKKLWNIATDAYINARLVKLGFPKPRGVINIPGADMMCEEEIYDMLLNNRISQNVIFIIDDHSKWSEINKEERDKKIADFNEIKRNLLGYKNNKLLSKYSDEGFDSVKKNIEEFPTIKNDKLKKLGTHPSYKVAC